MRWLLLAVLVGGCGGDDSGADKPTSIVRCESCGSIALCYRDAAGACPAGYDILKTDCNVVDGVSMGFTFSHAEITIRCH